MGPTRPVIRAAGRADRGRPESEHVRARKEGSRSDVSERGWVTIENALEIAKSPEDVFDYLTDVTKEVEWNPRTRRAEKLTPGPIGPARGSARSGSRATRRASSTSGSSVRRPGHRSLVRDAWTRRAR